MQRFQTPGQELRYQYMQQKSTSFNHNDEEYMNKLIKMGIQPNQNLYPSFFKLRNGLEYPGMATKSLIKNNQILVKVPQRLILSSMAALKQPLLKNVFEEEFYKLENCWEDRVLLTYCLFILGSKAPQSIFKQMIQHMSKDIDVALSWTQQQLDLIKDKTVKSAAILDQQSFDEQWADFQVVQKKYQILQTPQFTKSNYLWIFIHITSRCFGKAMDYTSFVPFCEFFNHHSSSVYYEINTEKPQNKQQKQEQDDLSSNGSNESDQYLEQGEFAYDEIQTVSYKWGQNQCLDLNKVQKAKIQNLSNQLLNKIQTEVDWKDFSVLFAGHFITRVKLIQNQYLEGRKGFQKTFSNLQIMSKILDKYIELIIAFYKSKNGNQYKYKVTTRENLQEKQQPQFKRPNPQSYKPNYTEFYLKTGKRDIFKQNNQVYFCYGPNSNRILLLRYGFAIEGNKYQHVWLSYTLNDILKQMPDLMNRIQKLGLSIRRKYKLNYCRLNMDLILFFRLNSWNLYGIDSLNDIFFVTNIPNQLQILQQICNSITNSLELYNDVNQQDLKNNKLNYHQYFAIVYNIQKKRILQKQLLLFNQLMVVLQRLADGQKMEKVCQLLSESEKYMFKYYLSTIVL